MSTRTIEREVYGADQELDGVAGTVRADRQLCGGRHLDDAYRQQFDARGLLIGRVPAHVSAKAVDCIESNVIKATLSLVARSNVQHPVTKPGDARTLGTINWFRPPRCSASRERSIRNVAMVACVGLFMSTYLRRHSALWMTLPNNYGVSSASSA